MSLSASGAPLGEVSCLRLQRVQSREDVERDPIPRNDLDPTGIHTRRLFQGPLPRRTRWLFNRVGSIAQRLRFDSFLVCKKKRNRFYSLATSAGPYGEQDDEQLFVQQIVPDSDQLYVRLASTGKR